MEGLVDQIGSLFSNLFALAQGGFDGVNQVTGLIIALIAAILMPVWRSLWGSALGATLVHLAVVAIRPALDGGSVALPDLTSEGFWLTALTLFLGYAIVIAIFFFIKTLLTGTAFRRGHRYAH